LGLAEFADETFELFDLGVVEAAQGVALDFLRRAEELGGVDAVGVGHWVFEGLAGEDWGGVFGMAGEKSRSKLEDEVGDGVYIPWGCDHGGGDWAAGAGGLDGGGTAAAGWWHGCWYSYSEPQKYMGD